MSHWIAVDWGTSNLRVFRMEGSRCTDRAQSDAGMGTLSQEGFEPALLALIDPWIEGPTEVMICGMAGARGGWVEAPYGTVPARPSALRPVPVPTQDPRLRARIVPGLRQLAPQPDVMRGEETQIAGFLAANPGFDGVLCLPGTHSKWVHISAQEIVSFQTFMTGELFALLGQASVLKASVAAEGWDEAAFASAVEQTLSRPEILSAALFGLRAAHLLQGARPEANRARLAGLLIGSEIAAAKPYWLGQNLALIGAPDLCAHYATALQAQGVVAPLHSAAEMSLLGLDALRKDLP